MWGAGWGYWGWGWWFWVFWACILILFIWAIAAAPWGGTSRSIPPEEQILRERYARGEISKEEFDQKIDDLRRAA